MNAQNAHFVSAITETPQTDKTTKHMLLRFDVNQAESFRRGIDCPKSTVTIDIEPSTLNQEDRNLVADRMDGIDVRCLIADRQQASWRIKALTPSIESLMEAIRQNEAEVGKNLNNATNKPA